MPNAAVTTRRALLATSTAAVAATVLTGSTLAGSGAPAYADRGAVPGSAAAGHGAAARRRFAALERRHGARLGVFAHNVRTGATVAYRAGERFPMCSTFKTLAVAAVLRDLDRHGEVLGRRVHYTQDDIDKAGGAPVTGKPENLAHGMTVAELCGAAISYSDNTAANLILRDLGGPTAVTRFARSLGDRTTRLDRWEPELNSAEPGRITDSTTPRALSTTYARLVLGRALDSKDRALLTGWLLANTTSGERFRAGLPDDWVIGDKTGTGSYGTANDAGITWTPDGTPIALTVLTTRPGPTGEPDSALVAAAAGVAARAVTA
ncbi:class A beta-lactamase [Streptomyces sp. VRA16 Mangrove soil]|uniref:class A beta-lactamase n=1 Tax=Streptomyces sp. VRA16 Mangrove soil TaxID=2817434 RepID=UPI0027DE8E13|nr:class A beta-lactamase [Streptomyces sp. VRA16 Mangrove soil]